MDLYNRFFVLSFSNFSVVIIIIIIMIIPAIIVNMKITIFIVLGNLGKIV